MSALSKVEAARAAGLIEAIDEHICRMLQARFDQSDGAVLLACALAVRAPRRGHVGVDLLEIDDEGFQGFPIDRAAWVEAVAASAVVRLPGPGSAPFVLRGSLLYTDRYHLYEDRLQAALRARFSEQREVFDPELLGQGLGALFPSAGPGDRQRRAAEVALRRGMTVISGGPGTGKTWTVRNLLTLIYAQSVAAGEPPPRLALAAPTGKAAARVLASIRNGLEEHLARAAGALPDGADIMKLQDFLGSAPPSTLHRLLGWRPEHPTRFRHDSEHPLPYDLIVVDEASMVDLAMMCKFVDAVPDTARVVILGDRHQLASVEAGTVLADICEGGGSDAVVFLTESRRFSAESGIGRFANAAVEGDVAGAMAAIPPWEAASSVPRPEISTLAPDPREGLSRAARSLVVEGYRPYLERLIAGPQGGESLEQLHLDALRLFDRFRVLCAHRSGRLGVRGVNDSSADWLREAGLYRGSGPWSLGRPVLITRNDYSVGRFNGDIGLVVRDEDDSWIVVFPGEGGGLSRLSPVRLPEHQTAFALTIHKSQGSEYDDVLVVLPDKPSKVLTRELVYTGVTRARKRVAVLSGPEVLREGLKRRVHRASGLAGRL